MTTLKEVRRVARRLGGNLNPLDRLVAWVAPGAGVRRLRDRTLLAMAAGGYHAGRKDRRPTQSWSVFAESADASLLPDLETTRLRSRDAARNIPLARGAINNMVTNVVGPGLTVRPQIDREALGLLDAAAEAWEAEAAREWNLWSESQECDFSRVQTFPELQALAFRSVLESGDCFSYQRMLVREGSPFAVKVQLIEADRVTNPHWAMDTATLAGGIETDPMTGEPLACYITRTHPGDVARGSPSLQWDRVPVFGQRSGRRNILHLFDRRRIGQSRGEPILAPVLEALKQLGDFTDAELQAAVVAAMFTVFVKTESGEGLAPSDSTQETGWQSSDKDIKLAPAAIVDLARGEDVTIANPGRPNQAFDMFVQAIVRQIGAALELPFEVLIKHFTASYSAARAALLDAWRFYRGRRRWLVVNFCQPVYEAVILESVARGRLAAPGLLTSHRYRKAWLGAMWVGPAMGSLDPTKENEADKMAQEMGWKTGGEITAEKTGGDFGRNLVERGREERRRGDAGLSPVGSSAPAAPLQLAPPAGSDAENERTITQ